MPPEWAFFYNQFWSGGINTEAVYDGEIDFVVVAPHLGILVIELKGGTVRRDGSEDRWWQRIPGGEEIEINPIRQVRRNKNFLKQWLSGLAELKTTDLPVYHALAFPDTSFRTASSNLGLFEQQLIIDARHQNALPERIGQILSTCRKDRAGNNWRDGLLVRNLMIKELTESFTIAPTLATRLSHADETIDFLTDEQKTLIKCLSRNKHALIEGCAGSGKTMLAVFKAKELALSGKRTLITCFNKALAQHIRAECRGIANLEVKTFHKLCIDASQNADGLRKNIASPAWSENVHMFLRHAMHQRGDLKYEAIVVDEGQDLTPQYWEALRACLVGDDAIFYVFADGDQNIRNGGAVPDLGVNLLLHRNIRNTRQIFEGWSLVCENAAQYETAGPDGPEIKKIVCGNETDIKLRLLDTIDELTAVGKIVADDIKVLSQFKTAWLDGQRTTNGIMLKEGIPSGSAGAETRLTANGRPRREMGYVHCSTISSFKGLESRVVILIDINERFAALPRSVRDASLYVGMSRARGRLIMIGTEAGFRVIPEI